MTVIAYVHSALQARLAEIRQDGERGDSPVPTAVIIMGLAALALVVTGVAATVAQGWLDDIPRAP